MTDGTAVRLALLFVVLPMVAAGTMYRVRSESTGESLDRRREGLFILATLRPAGLALWGAVFAYLINPRWMAWSAVPLPGGVRWAGVAICATAAGLVLWTMHRLGRNLTDTVVTRREHSLVREGPYRFVRHPLYGAVMLLVVGLSLAAANWFICTLGALVVTLLVIRTRTEEAHLLKRFGPAYAAYVAATGRFFPKRSR